MSSLSPLPVALPLAVAALLMAVGPFFSRRLRDTLAIATGVGVVVLCALLLNSSLSGPLLHWFGGWEPRQGIALGICFMIDPFGAGLALLAALLVTASLIFSWRYFDEAGPLYLALMLAFLGAMMGFCLTGDLFNLFVFFELMGVAAYALTGHKIVEEQAVMGAFSFAITNSIGAFLVLTGIALLYGRTGALNLAQIGQSLHGSADGLVLTALVLILCGFGIKAALVPFHFWLADAHAVAPSPVCVLFSGVMVELGLYAIARILWTVFGSTLEAHAPAVRDVLIGMGLLTALVGALMCFGSRHLKRLLAFSTISHAGILLVGVACLGPQGLAGAALYLVGHGLVKGALFMGSGMLLNRFASVDILVLHGRGGRFPLLGLLFVVAGLGLSGMPPFGTWLGKSLMDEALERLGHSWLPPILLLASGLTGGAVLKSAGHVFLGWGPRDENSDQDTPRHEEKEVNKGTRSILAVMFLPAATLTLLALAVGLWPGLEEQAQKAAARFVDRHAYAAAVLEDTSVQTVEPEQAGAPLPGILYGLGATLAAVVFALGSLFPGWIPWPIRKIVGAVQKPALAGLRILHSGHLGDYVAWIVAGMAVVGGVLAVLIRR